MSSLLPVSAPVLLYRRFYRVRHTSGSRVAFAQGNLRTWPFRTTARSRGEANLLPAGRPWRHGPGAHFPGGRGLPVCVRRDAVLLDLAVERLGIDAEHGGRLRPVPAHVAQRGDDVLPLHLLQAPAGGRTRRAIAADLVGPVRGLDHVSRGEDHRALDRVLQLAHVAGPAVA